MGMTSGKLDRRISILRSELVDDGYGPAPGPYLPIGTLWAHRRDVSDKEQFAAAQVQASITTRFTVRSSLLTRSVNPKDRIQHGDQIFNITGAKESSEGRLSFIELTAVARADL